MRLPVKRAGSMPETPVCAPARRLRWWEAAHAGLAAAQELNRKGHQVTVYERSDRIGGLLMYGIPNMKLEKSVIDRRDRR